MEKDSLRNTASWRIETQTEPGELDSESPDVKAFQELVGRSTVVGRRIYIESAYDEENTPERASQLRKLAIKALGQFELEQSKLDDVAYVLGELIQNAQRYSDSGPVWLSIVQTAARLQEQEKELCVIDVTVANYLSASPVQVQYEDEIDPDMDRMPDVPVHGRGTGIVNALSEKSGQYVFHDKRAQALGVYALLRCHDEADGQGFVAAA